MPPSQAFGALEALDFLGADRTGRGIWIGDYYMVRLKIGLPCCDDCIFRHPLGECPAAPQEMCDVI